MAAPKKPNTAAATAAVRRKAQDRKAAELRAAGWTVAPPEDGADRIRPRVCQECKQPVDSRHLDGCSWQYSEEWVSFASAPAIGWTDD